MSQKAAKDKIRWDLGSAYDLFISMMVLHHPSDFGVRAAWAAGMRQRIPTDEREFLGSVSTSIFKGPPLQWLATLPSPKDSLAAIGQLEEMVPLERFYSLAGIDGPLLELYFQIAEQGKWDQSQADTCIRLYKEHFEKTVSAKATAERLDSWASANETGDRIASALRIYYEAFFAEEERRILPYLEQGLERARQIAADRSFSELIFELSQGVRYEEEIFAKAHEIVLAPSFWSTPTLLIYPGKTTVITFGARPAQISLIPGEPVPDSLLAGLTALSDPTRLRILRYLKTDPLTPTQLAARLRLRAPTVIHHLKNLRNAGLVTLISTRKQKETIYEIRQEGLETVWKLLTEYFYSQEES
jgi:DNA-binding transcriptional ArsR family regulator